MLIFGLAYAFFIENTSVLICALFAAVFSAEQSIIATIKEEGK